MLLDENGESLSGRDGPPPPRLREAIAAAEAGNNIVQLPGGGRLRTAIVVSQDGRSLRWVAVQPPPRGPDRSEEHTSELQSLTRIPYAVFRLKTKTTSIAKTPTQT